MFEYFIPANYSIESKTDIRSIYTYMKLVDIGNNCRRNPNCRKYCYTNAVDHRLCHTGKLGETTNVSRAALAQPITARRSIRFALIGLSLLIPSRIRRYEMPAIRRQMKRCTRTAPDCLYCKSQESFHGL